MNRQIIPDVYTEYDDGRIGAIAPALANIEAKIGPAQNGTPGQLYVLSGPTAKAQAKTIFTGGPLLRAIEQSFDAGTSTVYAWRIGGADAGFLELSDNLGQPAIRLIAANQASYSDLVEVTVGRQVDQHVLGLLVVDTGSGQVQKVNLSGTVLGQLDYTNETTDPRGVFTHFGAVSSSEFRLLGVDGSGTPKLWHYDFASGGLIAANTIDLSAVIPVAEQVTGLVMVQTNPAPGAPAYMLTTDKGLYGFADFGTAPQTSLIYHPFTTYGITNANIQAAAIGFPIGDFDNLDPDRIYYADPTARKIYRNTLGSNTVNEISIAGLTGSDYTKSLAYDFVSDLLYVGVGAGNTAKVVAIDPSNAAPTDADALFEITASDSAAGLSFDVVNLDITSTVTIRDTGASSPVPHIFTARGAVQLADAINAGQGVVAAEALSNASPAATIQPLFLSSGSGNGSGMPTNGDYITGLERTTNYPEISWIHPVGATSHALWVATLTHCASMLDDHLSERFAILETYPFETSAEPHSAQYLADLQNYVDQIAAQMDLIGDRNAVVFPGGAEYLDSDGVSYVGPVAAACGGLMASLPVQKSLINKQVPGVLKLVPEFQPGHLQQLIQARTNPVRRKPGRGFVVAHSLTGATPGSDYSRANDLRAIYYGSKQARLAAQPYTGEENDEAGLGLQTLESAMSRPLETMRDAPQPQIDDFDIQIRSNSSDRLLGDVYVDLGIKPLRAMEFIYTTVYVS